MDRDSSGAAGPGFEPGLSDSELKLLGLSLFAEVPKTAYLGRILRSRVSLHLPMFARVTVKSLSKQTECRRVMVGMVLGCCQQRPPSVLEIC